jgi:hypothetical protein
MMLYLTDDSEEQIETDPPEQNLEDQITVEDQHHLSLNAMKGNNGVGTLRFSGQIGKIPVHILIAGGSSYTYLQPRIAQFLKLPIETMPKFKVLVGNGQSLTVEGMVKQLHAHIQGHDIVVPTYLLPIAGADLILGSSWHATLGPHIADYATLTLKFCLHDKFITLQGNKMTGPQQSQLHQLKQMQQTHAIAECFTVQLLHNETGPEEIKGLSDDVEPEIAMLLKTYKGVFQTPSGLPPPREENHAIPLLPGSKPVKVKPYRYPHSQKEQIEKMVQEMLEQGIIKPSNSPFSSPVILVKKKDGSWRFCTDYRARNSIIIKDSFPMPTVDELIDELHGARYFSKLDLRSGYNKFWLTQKIGTRPLFEHIMVIMNG